ncbi:class IV adenylate cyclase [Labilibaculum sp.]|uniref:class IV adenylate cyclase n=1 Tax=Labilibaculum sp. TaxID=2060723 RepID=UPI003567080C
MPTSIEIKAYCNNKQAIKEILLSNGAKLQATDHQTDTYFHSKSGRLKLREGKAENQLIHYIREDKKGCKKSKVVLYKSNTDSSLKEILEKTVGSKCIVDKIREIYLIDNVIFHIDTVKGLGNFVEIEAMDTNGTIPTEKLQEQCNHYIKILEINAKDLLAESYSDLLQQNQLFNQILIDE